MLFPYTTLFRSLANIDKVSGKKRKENLKEFADQARLSLKLVTLHDDCAVDFEPDALRLSKPNFAELNALFTELEFGAPLRDAQKWMEEKGWLQPEVEVEVPAAAPQKASDQLDIFSATSAPVSAKKVVAGPKDLSRSGKNYRAVRTVQDFDAVLLKLAEVDRFAFDVETTSLNPLDAQICGMSLAWQPNDAVYIPCAHTYEGVGEQLDLGYVLEKLRPFLEEEELKKVVGQHLKYEWLVLKKYGIDLRAIHYDTMLMSYLLDPGSNKHGMDAMALEWLEYETITFEDVAGKGKDQLTFDQVHLDAAVRSEERRVGKSVDLGGWRSIKKKK